MNEAESMIVKSTCCTCINSPLEIRTHINRGTWLAQSVEHATLDLGVVSSKPRTGRRDYFLFVCLKILFIYLFIYLFDRQRSQVGREAEREEEAGSPQSREPNGGLDPRTLGS